MPPVKNKSRTKTAINVRRLSLREQQHTLPGIIVINTRGPVHFRPVTGVQDRLRSECGAERPLLRDTGTTTWLDIQNKNKLRTNPCYLLLFMLN